MGDLCKLMSLVFRDNYTAGSIPSQILDGQTLREWILPVYDSSVAQDEVGIVILIQAMTSLSSKRGLADHHDGHALGVHPLPR